MDVDKAIETQLKNLQARSGRTLELPSTTGEVDKELVGWPRRAYDSAG